ncbi:MAG: hypothetical protein AAF745_10065 [Planctomycetota bacterium]
MTLDPTSEIKRIRHQLGAEDDFDLDRIFSRLRRMRATSTRTYVSGTPRKPADNHTMHRSGGGSRSGDGESTAAAR